MNNEQVHTDIDELIARFLTGNLDKGSFSRLKQWTAENEEHRTYVRKSIEIGFSSAVSRDTTHFSSKRGYTLFRQRIADYKQEMDSYRRHFPWKIVAGIAATALLILLPLAGFRLGKQAINQHLSGVKMETAMGARTQLTLPDGTEVWLNAGSCLTYPKDFGINNRSVTLQGEAYFDVTHNKELPFEINTKEIDLKVLGTKFTFRNYADDEAITVDLAKGKVSLNDHLHHRKMYLSPNERMTYDKKTGEMKKTHINADYSSAWTKEELYFDEVPLSKIAKELTRAYNVKISVSDRLKNKSFYGSFNITKNTVDDILETLSSTGKFKFRYKKGEYLIY